MTLAAIQTIGNILMLLPVRPQTFLEVVRILEFGNILKLVDTDNDFKYFFLCNIFSDVEKFVGTALNLLSVEIERHFIHRVVAYD